MEVVESWWNSRHGDIPCRRVRLRNYGDRWSVELVGPWARYEVIPCANEADARAVMARELVEGEKWRRLDHLYRPPSE